MDFMRYNFTARKTKGCDKTTQKRRKKYIYGFQPKKSIF